MENLIPIIPKDDQNHELAEELSEKTGLPIFSDIADEEPHLVFRNRTLYLVMGNLEMSGDFSRLGRRIRNISHEQIVRAVRFKGENSPLLITDCTAGLGEDSFLLAAAGNSITLYEKDPVICALLFDAHRRALEDENLKDIASKMRVIHKDSVEALKENNQEADVIYLDPMFSDRREKSSTKKKLQLIRSLEKPSENEEELLLAAKSTGPRKIVIKRPLKGPYLCGVTPTYSIPGKLIRYDCIVL